MTMTMVPVQQMAEEISGLFSEKLAIRGRTLAAQARKARRFLPKAVRADAAFLSESVKLADHPKLARRIDPTRAQAAYENCKRHLEAVDPAERRKSMWLGIVTSVAWAIFVVIVLFVVVLVWRGFV
ncbi:hypothetical protein [Pseudoruegeria sp. SHC-113]|uniref:hypothetical protein n=1 Tax=Pseudoruegeria sp. SHC-113 TaxID=2855439 RepID=UPI0021BA7606|nr:hypothetical protein [Pseudoruegeria sp. SHC-113]MCT8159076.1 hypothetical protein [Pseudoruegeria sp. SHC-113]